MRGYSALSRENILPDRYISIPGGLLLGVLSI
jgi:hypothetical protein